MAKLTRVRQLTELEAKQVRILAHSRTQPARLVERAKIIWLSHTGHRAPLVAEQLSVCGRTVRRWITSFNDRGLEGLADNQRGGRPPTYTQQERSEVVAASLTDPQSLGLPFGSWTLD